MFDERHQDSFHAIVPPLTLPCCDSWGPCCTIVDERNAMHRVTGHRRAAVHSDTRKLALPGIIMGDCQEWFRSGMNR